MLFRINEGIILADITCHLKIFALKKLVVQANTKIAHVSNFIALNTSLT